MTVAAGRGIKNFKEYNLAGVLLYLPGHLGRNDLQQVAADVEACGRRALVQVTDVLEFDQLQRLADVAMAEFGRIDILVNNGNEAVAAIRQQRPDLVFLDVQMPDLDGFGVMKALAGQPGYIPPPPNADGEGNLILVARDLSPADRQCKDADGQAWNLTSWLESE